MKKFICRKETLLGYLFISPFLVRLVFLSLGPVIAMFYLSGTDYAVVGSYSWVGLANYEKSFFADPLFWKSLANTAFYMVFTVSLSLTFGFLLAILLNTKIKGMTLYRTVYYIPVIVPIVANSMVWLWLFNARMGVINYVLSLVGLDPVRWLTDPRWAKPSLILMSLWGIGTIMIIFLAGLQNMSQQLYEAAEIDGANFWHRFLHVTVPMMTPLIFYNLIMGIISSFQVFAAAFIMTAGGPVNETLFYMLHLYNNAFKFMRMGYACALAVILFIMVFSLTVFIFYSRKKWVYYEV